MGPDVPSERKHPEVVLVEPAEVVRFRVRAELSADGSTHVDQVDVLVLPVDRLDLDMVRTRKWENSGLGDGQFVRRLRAGHEKAGLLPHLSYQGAEGVLGGFHVPPGR